MSILPTWPIAAGALVVGLAGGFYFEHTRLGAKIDRMEAAYSEELRVREVARSSAERKARDIEQRAAVQAGKIEQDKQDEIARIRADSASAIARLQSRPDRKPASPGAVPGAAPACAGATGAELSRPDGEFLVGLAGRADEHRAALQACYRWADEVISASQAPAQ
jgi:hypothetical protein